LPRFSGENFQRNLDLVDKVRSLAEAKGVTAGQLALAWLLAQGNDVAPIPGTKRRKYLAENLGAIDVTLTAEELKALDEAFPPDAVAGDRYTEAAMKAVER
jgi:aryl-alcohol dehydrogenase-like predicted oxidoreductase